LSGVEVRPRLSPRTDIGGFGLNYWEALINPVVAREAPSSAYLQNLSPQPTRTIPDGSTPEIRPQELPAGPRGLPQNDRPGPTPDHILARGRTLFVRVAFEVLILFFRVFEKLSDIHAAIEAAEAR
jgi:hypothetical protein